MRSYRLFFVPRTEDELVRHGASALPTPVDPKLLAAKKSRFEAFVERRKEELKPVLEEREEQERVRKDKEAERAEEEKARVEKEAKEVQAEVSKMEEDRPVVAEAAVVPPPASAAAEQVVPAVAPVEEDVKMSDA